jgi:hypothetical protein
VQPIPDALQDGIGLTEHLIVPESEHFNSFLSEPRTSSCIIAGLPLLGMTTPIQFDGQLLLCAVKIYNVGTNRPLTLEFDSSHPTIAQHEPQQRLGVGLIAPQLSCS